MNENAQESTRFTAGQPKPELCSHRGHAREFARDEGGRVRMTCRACGEEVKPAAHAA